MTKPIFTKIPYPPPLEQSTQVFPLGVKFDFNYGLRMVLPPYNGNSKRKVRIYDYIDTPLEKEFQKETYYINDLKTYFIKYRIELFEGDTLVYEYEYNATGKDVLIHLHGALGDHIAWLAYISRFQEIHKCNLTVTTNTKDYIPLFKSSYPNLNIVDRYPKNKFYYATYIISYQSKNDPFVFLPRSPHYIGLCQVAEDILGLNEPIGKTKINIMSPNVRPIKEKYVVVAPAASSGCKMWNNPNGWGEVTKYLIAKGYRVVCVDKTPVLNGRWPDGLENQTGPRPLPERARWIAHADLFIGLGSGLSWMAWALGTPVVLISGFSHPVSEFYTPYRVFNNKVCNSCWNDLSCDITGEMDCCPRHRGTARQFECSVSITSDMVTPHIDRALVDRA